MHLTTILHCSITFIQITKNCLKVRHEYNGDYNVGHWDTLHNLESVNDFDLAHCTAPLNSLKSHFLPKWWLSLNVCEIKLKERDRKKEWSCIKFNFLSYMMIYNGQKLYTLINLIHYDSMQWRLPCLTIWFFCRRIQLIYACPIETKFLAMRNSWYLDDWKSRLYWWMPWSPMILNENSKAVFHASIIFEWKIQWYIHMHTHTYSYLLQYDCIQFFILLLSFSSKYK